MAIVQTSQQAFVEVIPVVLDSQGNVVSRGVPTLRAMPIAAKQDPAAAADVAALKTQFDALLTKLKDAGLMLS